MSSNIWTQYGGDSNLRPLAVKACRVVEARHRISTRRLVDSGAEQDVLEAILEVAKPPIRDAGLHYLLYTPFRYPPLRHGSRFGRRVERGIWYGALELHTALAEVAFYRLLFLEGTSADLGTVSADLQSFWAKVETRHGADLTKPPFEERKHEISSPTSYAFSQSLGSEMRAAGIRAFLYESARDPRAGINVGILDAAAFGVPKPFAFRAWYAVATKAGVEFISRELAEAKESLRFPRGDFLVDGGLPQPALT